MRGDRGTRRQEVRRELGAQKASINMAGLYREEKLGKQPSPVTGMESLGYGVGYASQNVLVKSSC